MQLFFDLIPIIVFFISYKLAGIYVATLAAMLVSIVQVAYYRIRHGHYEKLQLITLILIIVLGSATIILHKPIYIKWKPTVIYWIFGLVFLINTVVNRKPLIQMLLEKKMSLPGKVWQRLNWSWCAYFLALGAANLYVVYHFSTNAWVNFKLFGTLILTLMFVCGQAFYLSKYAENKNDPH